MFRNFSRLFQRSLAIVNISISKILNFLFPSLPERLLELQCHLLNYIRIFGSLTELRARNLFWNSAWPRNVPEDLQTQKNTRKSFWTGETKTELFLTISKDFQGDRYWEERETSKRGYSLILYIILTAEILRNKAGRTVI